MIKQLLILGSGQLGRVVAELAKQQEFTDVRFLDDYSHGCEILGACQEYEQYKTFTYAYPAFGNDKLRLEWIEKLRIAGFLLPTLIHHTAYVSPTVRMSDAVLVLPKAVIHANTIVGEGTIVNIGVLIDHDVTVNKGAHLCTGAIINPRSNIPEFTKIKAGSIIDEQTVF